MSRFHVVVFSMNVKFERESSVLALESKVGTEVPFSKIEHDQVRKFLAYRKEIKERNE